MFNNYLLNEEMKKRMKRGIRIEGTWRYSPKKAAVAEVANCGYS
jgi:hypothetical protein